MEFELLWNNVIRNKTTTTISTTITTIKSLPWLDYILKNRILTYRIDVLFETVKEMRKGSIN